MLRASGLEDEDFKINNVSTGKEPPSYNIEEVSEVSIGYDNEDVAVYDTINYKPYVGQWSGTETVQINRYSSTNYNQEITSHFSFLEISV